MYVCIDTNAQPLIFSPGMMSVDAFSSCRFWGVNDKLFYDFGLEGRPEFKAPMQSAILALVKAARFGAGQGFQLKNNCEPAKLHALKVLEASGIAEKTVRESWTEWRMTAVGQRRLRTSQAASKSEAALTAAADVPLEEKSVFQLLCDMHAEKLVASTCGFPKPGSHYCIQARAREVLVAERH